MGFAGIFDENGRKIPDDELRRTFILDKYMATQDTIRSKGSKQFLEEIITELKRRILRLEWEVSILKAKLGEE